MGSFNQNCFFLSNSRINSGDKINVDDLKEMMVRDYKKLSLKELEEILSEYS